MEVQARSIMCSEQESQLIKISAKMHLPKGWMPFYVYCLRVSTHLQE